MVNNRIKIDPHILNIPEFKAIWDRDKARDKDTAMRELGYLYYVADFKSPYAKYPDAERKEKSANDFIRKSRWKEDEVMKEAIEKYKELQFTPELRLLQSAANKAKEISDYYDKQRVTDDNIKDITASIQKIGSVYSALVTLQEQAKKKAAETKIKGGGKESLLESWTKSKEGKN